jgi:hypothetical protein
MLLHGLRAGSSVVTDTGCCPSAAPDIADRCQRRAKMDHLAAGEN